MGEGYTFAMGGCWSCGTLFTFDVEEVPSVITDSRTGKVAAEGTPEAFQLKQAICDPCADTAEKLRKAEGLPVAWPRRQRR
jgi:hypothetical protein